MIFAVLLLVSAQGLDVQCNDPFGLGCVEKRLDCNGGDLKCTGRGVCKNASVVNCKKILCKELDACVGMKVEGTNSVITCEPAMYQCDISETESYSCKNVIVGGKQLNDVPKIDCELRWKGVGVKLAVAFHSFSLDDLNAFTSLLHKSLQPTTVLIASYICPLSPDHVKPVSSAANDSCRTPSFLQAGGVITATTSSTIEYSVKNGVFVELILTREGHSFEGEYNALLEGLRELSMGKGPMSTSGVKDLDPYCDGDYLKTTQEGDKWSVRGAAEWAEPKPSPESESRPGLLAAVLVLSAGFLAVSGMTLNIVVKGKPRRTFHQAPQINVGELLDRDPNCLEHMETAEMELQAYYRQQQGGHPPSWRSPTRSRSSLSRSSSGSSEGRKYRPAPPPVRFSPLVA